MMRHRLSVLATMILTVLSAATTARASARLTGIADQLNLSPFWSYKTIETDHFRIVFPKELASTAEKIANYLEEANSILSPALYWKPHYKANILVIDNIDSENGETSPVLRFGITLFVTPPDNWDSLAYYDNWLRELCIHEYTHFLNMDATRGLWKWTRYVFGDTTLPNALWPSWMLEGLAVYDETRFTLAGRGRSPYYDMVLRSSVMEHVLDTRDFITLDKVNGRNPWYPGGETPYLFGYELMNQVARDTKPGPTADGDGFLNSGSDALGIMSKRSSWRVPFFINGNLENITGEDWYKTWDVFVRESRIRADEELRKIRSAPVTPFKRLTSNGYDLYGPKLSPDGNWIAYTHDGLNDISGLYLLNRRTGDVVRLMDKDGGVSLAFTKDSRFLFESRLHRINEYYLFSDIEVLNLQDGSTQWLTSRLRARDPSLSPDEKWVAFTLTKNTTTRLALAPLIRKGDDFSIGRVRMFSIGKKFDRISTPQFAPDGSRIAFSIHHNGDVGEEIWVYDIKRNRAEVIASDGSLNRYPAWDPAGNLYFISDRTGVDNLYRYGPRGAEMVSNFETGIAFPSFSPSLGKNQYLATIFSTKGWDVAIAELPNHPYSPSSLTLSPPPAPAKSDQSVDHAASKNYPVENYSIWPTILPRAWSPIFAVTGQGEYLGGAVTGFDQADRNRYFLTGAYDTFVQKGDVFAVYDNRYLGATIEAAASLYTSSEFAGANGNLAEFGRTQDYSLSAYYPIEFTYSTLTPSISYNLMREIDYIPDPNGPDIPIAETQLVPNVSGLLTYSDVESSPLAVVPERGRTALIGERLYMNSGQDTWKGLAADYEHISFGDTHVVLQPTIKGSWVSATSPYAPADVLVQGNLSNPILNGLATDSFDHLLIRGYPLQAFYTRAAMVASADLDFPLWRIFAGPGTDPIFLENLYGDVFGETTYFPAKDVGFTTLPSTGGGVHLGIDLTQNLPLDLSLQYNKGFQVAAGGTGELVFAVGFSAALATVY